jgi:alanyl-tRNA synthetase
MSVADRIVAAQFAATVTDIRLNSTDAGGQLWQVALDRTAFSSARSLGRLVAVARSGAKLEVAVERVEEDAVGEVWHYVRKPLLAGTQVTGHVESPTNGGI